MTVKEFAKKYGVTERRVQILLKQGRIPARKGYGGRWYISDDAVYPTDARQSAFTLRWGDITRTPVNE